MKLRFLTLLAFFTCINISAIYGSHLFDGIDQGQIAKRSTLFQTKLQPRPELCRPSMLHIAITNGFLETVGSIDFKIMSKHNAHISLISIFDEGDMNKGHGVRALKLLFKLLKKNNFASITLDVDPENEVALYIYQKLGFRVIRGIGQENDPSMLLMRKRLTLKTRKAFSILQGQEAIGTSNRESA